MPTVSVVIPAFNAVNSLDETIASVQQQLWTDLEIVIVDDGSTDGTLSMAEGFSKHDSRISVIHQKNQGVSAARNTGLRAANGDWLMVIDADDEILPTHVSSLVCLGNGPLTPSVVFSQMVRRWPSGALGPNEGKVTNPIPRPLDFDETLTPPSLATGVHTALFSRDAAQQVGDWDETLHAGEDWDYWIRLARTGVPVAGTGMATAIYQMRKGSLSRKIDRLLTDGSAVTLRYIESEEQRLHLRFLTTAWAAGLEIAEHNTKRATELAALEQQNTVAVTASRIGSGIAHGIVHGICEGQSFDVLNRPEIQRSIDEFVARAIAKSSAPFWMQVSDRLDGLARTGA